FDAIMVKPEPTLMINGYTGKLVTIIVHFWIANGFLESRASNFSLFARKQDAGASHTLPSSSPREDATAGLDDETFKGTLAQSGDVKGELASISEVMYTLRTVF